ncbi:MAG: DUF177 domain-containing protein [Leptolyngbyaceae cyanobacterium SL_7_1]|nr:DUF177 domain-containing protein [Leptolyngbyaceae cyanobacterium SL_7_1]
MHAIYIPHLAQVRGQTEKVEVRDHLPELETLTPVQGEVQVWHRGNYLEVKARAEAIMTLSCDRCLQQYNHRLSVDTSELIWLQEEVDEAELPLEREVAYEDLVETLPPDGYFHPDAWLYEQLCLEIPQRQLCDSKCPGVELIEAPKTLSDRRWASLEALKQQLPNN